MRRTHLWISLLVGLVVWGAYFSHVALSVRRGDTGGLWIWFLGALAAVVLAEGVVTGLLAWLFRRRNRVLGEGPTLQAALQASHVALMLLIVMMLIGAALLVVAANFSLGAALTSQGLVIIANGLLFMVVVAELTRAAFTLALLPRR